MTGSFFVLIFFFVFWSFDIAKRDKNACGDNEQSADEREYIYFFIHKEHAREHARDRLKRAEHRGSASSDEKGSALKEHDCAYVYDKREEYRQAPAERRARKRELIGKQTYSEHNYCGYCRDEEAEGKDRAFFVFVSRKQDDIDRVGKSRHKREQTSERVGSATRVVEERYSSDAHYHAYYTSVTELAMKEDKLTEHHCGGIYKMEYRSRARGYVVIRREEQKRGETAAHKSDEAYLWELLG